MIRVHREKPATTTTSPTALRIVSLPVEYATSNNYCWSGFPCKWRYINVETFHLPPPAEVEEFSSAETTTSAATEEPASIGICEVCLVSPKDDQIVSVLPCRRSRFYTSSAEHVHIGLHVIAIKWIVYVHCSHFTIRILVLYGK